MIDTDLKFYKSENQTNTLESGGEISSEIIEDNKLHNLFDSVTPGHRQNGFLDIKKVYSKVDKLNSNTVYNEFVSMIANCTDANTSILLMDSKSDKEQKKDIIDYIAGLWKVRAKQTTFLDAAMGDTVLNVTSVAALRINVKYLIAGTEEPIIFTDIDMTLNKVYLKEALKQNYLSGGDIYDIVEDASKELFSLTTVTTDVKANDKSVVIKNIQMLRFSPNVKIRFTIPVIKTPLI